MNAIAKAGTFIAKHLLTRRVELGGRVYRARLLSANELALGEGHEPWLDDVFAALLALRPGGFVDVGVNRGQTLGRVLRLDPRRPYVGFEPQAAAAAAVEQFIAENDLGHCTVVPIGLSNERGLVRLHVRGTTQRGALVSPVGSIVDRFRPADYYTHARHVAVAPGDEVLPSLLSDLGVEGLAVIKIDVEGAELEVVEGLASTLQAHRPFLVFEVLHNYLAFTDERLSSDVEAFRMERVARLEASLRSSGYAIYHVHGLQRLDRVARIQPQPTFDFATTDYVAVPLGEEEAFASAMARTRAVTR